MNDCKHIMAAVEIISVVRDCEMYNRCISNNLFCSGCGIRMLDNRERNVGVPALYNGTLDSFDYSYPRWLVFCHEDFMPKELLRNALGKAREDRIYGTIGGVLLPKKTWLLGGLWRGEVRGMIVESEKDGTGARCQGVDSPLDTIVETIDCQCLIVHSSLVQKYGLRFDERLSFDLYTEDFCLGAYLKHGIKTAIFPLKCQHFSRGTVLPRFFEQKAYLDRKYPKAEAFGCVGYTIGGGRTVMRRFQKRVRTFLDRHARFAVEWYFKVIG